MARFIAKYRRYRLGVRKPLSELLAGGQRRIIRHGVVAEFQHGIAREYEREAARKLLKIVGTTIEQDEVTPVDPFSGPGCRLSVYDTDDPMLNKQWAEMELVEKAAPGTVRKDVEEFMRSYGANGIDYIEVEPVKVPAPWPKYDSLVKQGRRSIEMVAEQIVETAKLMGLDPETVLHYERGHLNRSEVIAALEELVAAPEAEEIVTA
ncbi:MAG: hypothetical protein WC565_03000 [Parcubacteria group bacterium]